MTGKSKSRLETSEGGVPVGKGYALWLVPDEPVFSLLARRISQLSLQCSTPSFDPHITLLAGITGKEKDAAAKTASVAGSLKPMQLELDGAGYLDEYFRCLFIRVIPTTPIMEAHQAAREAFGLQKQPSYMPHLSLVYGNLRIEAKKEIAATLGALSGQILEVRKLSLYRVSGPTNQWRCVQKLSLRSG